MAQILHLACHGCGKRLKNPREAYCPPCNLRLCYRAMPILLGMLLTGHLSPDLAALARLTLGHPHPGGYDDEAALIME